MEWDDQSAAADPERPQSSPPGADPSGADPPGAGPQGGGSLPALFRFCPSLEQRIPWVPLGHFPTPVEPVRLGGRTVWVKRDDLSAQPYGGNKVRKLEFILGAARRDRIERLVTAGALGSHHALATAVFGRRLGFEVTLVLFPQRVNAHVRHVLLADQALGVELRFTGRMETVPLAVAAARWAHRQEAVLTIPPGGSDAVGTLGYVSGGLELAEQVRRGEAPAPAVVHVAGGTLGTAAGMAIGLALAGLPVRIVATRITGRIVTNRHVLGKLVRGALALLEADVAVPDADAVLERVEIEEGWLGEGYGRSTPEGDAATALLGATGLQLDPTYTAKAAASLLADESASPILFWHTLSAAEPPLPAGEAALEAQLPAQFRELLEG